MEIFHHSLSSFSAISGISLLPKLSFLRRPTTTSTTIRMGGGPRTFPGGVSKWEWKRMQAKKSKQLLKARLARERQIYEMRKRAELKAAVSDLERPWEVISRAAPNSSALFSVSADEQLKVLADRFQKPGGFDLWSEDDGPQLFESPDGLPTSRFFPKGVVHSIKPYSQIRESEGGDVDGSTDRVLSARESGDVAGRNSSRGSRGGGKLRIRNGSSGDATNSAFSGSKPSYGGENEGDHRSGKNGGNRINGNGAKLKDSEGRTNGNGSKPSYGGENEGDHRSGKNGGNRINGNGAKLKDSEGRTNGNGNGISVRGRGSNRGGYMGRLRRSGPKEVYDLRLQGDGSYGFRANNKDLNPAPNVDL